MSIQLKKDKIEEIMKERGWNKTVLAKRLGVDRSSLWRNMLPTNDKRHMKPRADTIESLLTVFPECKFEDLFVLDKRR